MANRARNLQGSRLGSAVFAAILLAGGFRLAAADSTPECTSCHEQGQKLAKSAVDIRHSHSIDEAKERHEKKSAVHRTKRKS